MTDTYPDNLNDALALLAEKDEEIERKDAENQELKEKLAAANIELDWFRRHFFGQKSEKIGKDDLPLFEGAEWHEPQPQGADESQPTPEREHIEYERKKPRGKRQPLSADLERVQRHHDVPQDQKICPQTGQQLLRWIGQETSEQLAYRPAISYVIQHVQHKYARVEENLDGVSPEVVTAEKPAEGLPKCIAAPSLLATVMVSKFADHIPLHRLERMLARSGISSARSSMCRWVQEVAALLAVLVDLMEKRIFESGTVQGDDTPTKQQEPGKGKTKTCRFWSYLGDGVTGGRYVVFRYTTDRSRDGPEKFFSDDNGKPRFHGKLQCDAYAGFQRLVDPASRWAMLEIACWAHVRRKFYDSRLAAPGDARWMLNKIQRLYRIEKRARVWNLSAAQRRALRARWSRPVVDEIFAWCDEKAKTSLPKGKLSAAIEYTRNRGEALRRYLYDGNVEIDNNGCERTIRAIALGRKNWLFTGSEAGGRAAAVLFSLIGTCQLHNVDPLAYLTDVITRLPTTPPEELEQLLPDRWSPATADSSA